MSTHNISRDSEVPFLVGSDGLNHAVLETINDDSYIFQVIKGLLKFWPKTCSQKEVCTCSYPLHYQTRILDCLYTF